MESQHYPVVVVGAGPGGYPCAIRLAQLGVKTLCIEKIQLGWRLSKCWLYSIKGSDHGLQEISRMKAAASMGLMFNTDSLSVDMEKTQEWKAGIVKRLTGGIAGLFKANGVDHMLGTVDLSAPKSSRSLVPKREQRITCDKLVLAVGSRPREIANFSYEDPEVLDSTKALDLQEVPARLAVIGGGYIGLEMGMMLAKLNAEVTVIEFADSVLAAFDPQVVREIKKKMKKLGMKTLTGAAAQDWERTEDGIVVRVKQGDELIEVPADKVLVTVGRVPNSEQLAPLGLEWIVGLSWSMSSNKPVSPMSMPLETSLVEPCSRTAQPMEVSWRQRSSPGMIIDSMQRARFRLSCSRIQKSPLLGFRNTKPPPKATQ